MQRCPGVLLPRFCPVCQTALLYRDGREQVGKAIHVLATMAEMCRGRRSEGRGPLKGKGGDVPASHKNIVKPVFISKHMFCDAWIDEKVLSWQALV